MKSMLWVLTMGMVIGLATKVEARCVGDNCAIAADGVSEFPEEACNAALEAQSEESCRQTLSLVKLMGRENDYVLRQMHMTLDEASRRDPSLWVYITENDTKIRNLTCVCGEGMERLLACFLGRRR